MRNIIPAIVIIVLLTACAPVLTPVTATATTVTTITPMPSLTSTAEPSATPVPTLTPTEIITPPEGFASMEEAAKLGWVYADENGDGQKELVQHMVVENGEIVFDKASLIPLGQEEFLKGFTYRVHPMDGKQFFPNFSSNIENPKPGFKWEWLHYEVKGLTGNDVKHFLDLAPKHYGYNIAFETDNPEKNYEFPNSESEFYQNLSYSTPGNPRGFLSIGLQIPIGETIQSIQLATRPGEHKFTIFEQGKMDPVTAK